MDKSRFPTGDVEDGFKCVHADVFDRNRFDVC
jgi:hypothetical protein